MKVFVEPTGLHSPAMVRIANALKRHAPKNVGFTKARDQADLVVMYVIGVDALAEGKRLTAAGRNYAAVQCCLKGTGGSTADWAEFWSQASIVWSYYDLHKFTPTALFNFYHAPLGVDSAFSSVQPCDDKTILAITTGHVDGPDAEAISEVWSACEYLGGRAYHVGPLPAGMPRPRTWEASQGITDEALANLYRRAHFVCGLRHVEGFELPAAEGLACGARPILFYQRDLAQWYGSLAMYVEECSGAKLIDSLTRTMILGKDAPVTHIERMSAIQTFDWERLAEGFWNQFLFPVYEDHRPKNEITDADWVETQPS